jgi:hypothetical protein
MGHQGMDEYKTLHAYINYHSFMSLIAAVLSNLRRGYKLLCSFLPFLALPLLQASSGILVRTEMEQFNYAIGTMTTNNMTCCVSC